MVKLLAAKFSPRRRVVTFTVESGEPLELHEDTVAEFGLRAETEIQPERVAEILRRDGLIRCRQAAWRLLSVRPRGRAELEKGLRQRRFLRSDVATVIEDLLAKGYLDDEALARQVIEESLRRRQGKRLIAQNLRQRGIPDATAESALKDATDPDRDRPAMVTLLERWNRRSKPEDPRKRALAAAGFLARRGYESALVWEVVRAFFRGCDDQEG